MQAHGPIAGGRKAAPSAPSGGMMTEVVDKRETLEETAHPTLDYIEFGLDGAETRRSGYIWGPAPAVAGGRVFWVLNVADGVVVPPTVAVVIASRRHRVGRTVYVPTRT